MWLVLRNYRRENHDKCDANPGKFHLGFPNQDDGAEPEMYQKASTWAHTCAYRKPEAIGAEVGMMMRLKESPEPPPPGKVPPGSEPVTSLAWPAQSRAGSML